MLRRNVRYALNRAKRRDGWISTRPLGHGDKYRLSVWQGEEKVSGWDLPHAEYREAVAYWNWLDCPGWRGNEKYIAPERYGVAS